MKKLSVIDTYTIPLLFVSLAAVVFRCIALLTSFNTVTMHFDNKTAITIGNIIVAVSTLAFLSYFIFGEKERKLIPNTGSAAYYIPSGIVSIVLVFMGAELIDNALGIYKSGVIFILSLLGGILALGAVFSFFLSIFIEKGVNSTKACLAICTVAFLAVYAMLLYFQKDVHPTNSPNRLIDQLAYLSSAIFFLYEARIPLGRTKWKGYIAFGLCAAMLCAYSSIPSIILYFAKGYVISESITESILTLTLALLIGSRIMKYKSLSPDSECSIAKEVGVLAARREEEIRAHRNRSENYNINNNEEKDEVSDAENFSFDIPDDSRSDTDDEG